MKWLNWLLGSSSKPSRTCAEIAERIVHQYHQRNASGDWQTDQKLRLDVRQVLPQARADQVVDQFLQRRSRSDPAAEKLLAVELALALHDVAHNAQTFKPIMAAPNPAPQAPDNSPPSAAKTFAKAIEGKPITDADEDAVLFGGFFDQ